MTAEALQAPPAQTERDAGWRDIAAVIGARVLARLRRIAAAVRPLAWVLLALVVGFCILRVSLLGGRSSRSPRS